MRCGIVVHSETGHTAEVARRIAERLRGDDHDVDLKLVRAKHRTNPISRSVTLVRAPAVDDYDVVIVGAPVHGFGASPVVLAYLAGLESLKGKIAIPFVTKSLPGAATGGRQALERMTAKLEAAGAQVEEGSIVHWLFGARKDELSTTVEQIATLIQRCR
jgi:flavodoxin